MKEAALLLLPQPCPQWPRLASGSVDAREAVLKNAFKGLWPWGDVLGVPR